MIRSIFAVVLVGALTTAIHAQETPAAATPATPLASPDAPPSPVLTNPIVDPRVQQTSGGCCNNLPPSGGLASYLHGGGCGAGGSCYPGRTCNLGCCSDATAFGRLFRCLCEELCCPDPCYEPMWIPAANAAFFQDSPRPVTQTRIRLDVGRHYNFPDTDGFFWAPQAGAGTAPKGPAGFSSAVNYNMASLYQEVAAKGASFFIEIPYVNVDPNTGNPGAGSLGDMNLGGKTVFLDRDLILITGQFRTYIPTGNATAGTGTGHVSLEPSILSALKLTGTTYLQMQLADWIPVGGSSGFNASVFHYHFSLNQNLCHVGDCFNLVGAIEFNGYSFYGNYTTGLVGGTPVIAGLNGTSYLNAGPSVRLQFCNRCDIGIGSAFGFGNHHGPDQIYRAEMRIRY